MDKDTYIEQSMAYIEQNQIQNQDKVKGLVINEFHKYQHYFTPHMDIEGWENTTFEIMPIITSWKNVAEEKMDEFIIG